MDGSAWNANEAHHAKSNYKWHKCIPLRYSETGQLDENVAMLSGTSNRANYMDSAYWGVFFWQNGYQKFVKVFAWVGRTSRLHNFNDSITDSSVAQVNSSKSYNCESACKRYFNRAYSSAHWLCWAFLMVQPTQTLPWRVKYCERKHDIRKTWIPVWIHWYSIKTRYHTSHR